ncbi:MAG: PAS domain-containing sensor histidine kinase, partial [Thiovulaceae bacterium]|nr:PAS domain-containing sensor histidine kinase [Sulfurimonadaceae bacterium]
MKSNLALSQDALKEELLIRKQTEQELQESKEDLMRAQELAKLGSWKWDIHDKYFSPSEAFQDIIGLANANEMIELDIFERLVSKEDKKYIQDFFAMIYQNYGVHQLLHSLVSLDGKEKIVRTYAEVQRDPQGNPTTIIGVTHDITTEQMVVKDNHKLLASIEQSPIFIIIINEKSIIEYINPITEKYYTYFDTPLVGKSISMFNHKENALVFNDILNIAKEENSWHGELIETDADGELHYMDTIITSIRDNNQRIVNYVIWKEDITQRKTQEKRFFEQTRQAQMGEMISMIAHQWRQPLTGISAISSLLKIKKELGTLNDEEFERNLGDLDSLVAHLSQTITDFRDFFKPDKELERISFGEILDKSLIVLGNALHSQNITVQNTIAKETVLELYASEFIQVLLNLFKNSLDAFKSNDITSGTITLDSHQDENYFEITYSDNAGGISAEVLENIFLPYFSTKGKKNGTGLGLYMSKTIIEDHLHGRITVQSIKEQTSFTIQLPLTFIVTF